VARTRLRVVAERAGVSVATAPPVMTPRVGHPRLATVADERGRQTAVLCLSVATAALIYLVAGARGLRVPNGPSVPIHRDAELPAVASAVFRAAPVPRLRVDPPRSCPAPMSTHPSRCS
jgi:hypothetical protein